MASLSDIRAGLKTNLETIPGLRAYDIVPDKVSPPFAAIRPDSPAISRETMARGVMQYRFLILVGVSRATDRAAQDALDAYLASSGTQSVWVAIESDLTLDGAASHTHVVACSDYGILDWNGVSYSGAQFEVEVLST